MLSERDDLTRLNYYYDSDGAVVELGVQKRASASEKWGTENRYFLVRNGSSDIVAIYRNSDSTLVGTYDYDAWGRVLSVDVASGVTDSDDIMNLNPFRYRSYYYDTETQFYYLNARYYDPATHRFISADSVIAGVSQGVTGYNLFAYCDNDPVNKTDSSGNWPEWSEIATSSNCKKVAIGLAVITAVAVLTVATGGAGLVVMSFAGTSMIQLVVGSATVGAVAGGLTSATVSALSSADTDQIITSAAEGVSNGFAWGSTFGLTVGVTGGSASTLRSVVEVASSVEQLQNVIPDKKDIMNHIFRDKEGHTTNILYKSVFEKVANNPANLLGPDIHGNIWYSKLLSDGRQVWAVVREGIIWDAGINTIKQYYDPNNGLRNGVKR